MEVPFKERLYAEETSQSGPAGGTLDGHYQAPPTDKDGKLWVRTCALVLKSADELYAIWRDIEKAPLWQEQIAEVRKTGPKTSHWIMWSGDNSDKTIEWDCEILNDEPGKRLAWRSTGGDSDNAGEVIFDAAPGRRGTIVTVLQEFRMGKLESVWETLTGRNPKQAVIENLRHLKALAETGEIPRTQGQPHGPRGISGKAKESLYGETTSTPIGSRRMAS
jgi:uncharacterized membrane protein